jgi:phosphoribosylformylglycinamidine synthase
MTISFFLSQNDSAYLVKSTAELSSEQSARLEWLLEAKRVDKLEGPFIGPRKEMVTPWSTNATEMAQNIGIPGVTRIEEFFRVTAQEPEYDRMLQAVYPELTAESLEISAEPKGSYPVTDVSKFNQDFGLALSDEEVSYLEAASKTLGRPLTDTEVYAFGQINSEHCRHKIFRGEFVIDGQKKPKSLFDLIRETSKASPKNLVSAYSDNVAFMKGSEFTEFAPELGEAPSRFSQFSGTSVLSLKAETHNFPTTVEPFNGASTGSGGEIRDRLAGGQGSIPLSGTAVYMTSYPRLKNKSWEREIPERSWKYQTPEQILIKASDGASDFGNKFGQPLLAGSLLTLEFKEESGEVTAFDRTIMLAGGVGYARAEYAKKKKAAPGDKIVLLGGDNYRIGMAGSSASSVDTGVQSTQFELNAVQRANAEMQKRVANVIRFLAEHPANPIISIHDHGAGGHLNCFSELLEETGGKIFLSALPVGDPTLSPTEILCNESQERMGLIISAKDVGLVEAIAKRERAPFYVVGEITGNGRIEVVADPAPMSLPAEVLLGSSPKITITDQSIAPKRKPVEVEISTAQEFKQHLLNVLSLEGVACKDWLTNKVDRCVSAKIAQQQCVGPLQLPLCGYGLSTLDYSSFGGVAIALGSAPGAGLIDPEAASRLSISEALTNLVFAPIEGGLESVVLSANWMWPAKQPGENARLYAAVEACSKFAIELGIAIPTGKDSLSMTMKYADGSQVKAPGTVIISASAPVSDFRLRVTPELKCEDSALYHLRFSSSPSSGRSRLGGGSLAQTLGVIGDSCPDVEEAALLKHGFNAIQELLKQKLLLAGHDVSSGGLITTLVEMAVVGDMGVELGFSGSATELFAEEVGVVIQVADANTQEVERFLKERGLPFCHLGAVSGSRFKLYTGEFSFESDLASLRHAWFETSHLLDKKQTAPEQALQRFATLSTRHLEYRFPETFTGSPEKHGIRLLRDSSTAPVRAAVIRDKGTNGERELAFSLYASGFEVVDVTMSDLVEGREDLSSVQLVAFPGGFSNSDVLGSGKGWAGTFLYNDKAMSALSSFVARPDTLLLGVCNGCQVVGELELLYPEHSKKLKLRRNLSKKFESAFLGVEIMPTDNIFLQPLVGTKLGVWVAHGEGRFELPEGPDAYDIPVRYLSSNYPLNPNGSPANAAGISGLNGRALIMMPHLERSIFPWNWGYYPPARREDTISPWFLAFRAAYEWCEKKLAGRGQDLS